MYSILLYICVMLVIANGSELGSKYANSLGFTNEIAWPESGRDSLSSADSVSKKRVSTYTQLE